MLDQLRVRWERLRGHCLGELQLDRIAVSRVEPYGPHWAVQVARRVGDVDVGVGVQKGLDLIRTRPEPAQVVEGKDRRSGVEDSRGLRFQAVDIPAKHRRRALLGLPDSEPWLLRERSLWRHRHEQSSRARPVPRSRSAGIAAAKPHRESQCARPRLRRLVGVRDHRQGAPGQDKDAEGTPHRDEWSVVSG